VLLRQEADSLENGHGGDGGIPAAAARHPGERLVARHEAAVLALAAFPDHRLGDVPAKRRDEPRPAGFVDPCL
jgi:hypothetical protein